jgi:hypothetical protein
MCMLWYYGQAKKIDGHVRMAVTSLHGSYELIWLSTPTAQSIHVYVKKWYYGQVKETNGQ